MYYRVRIWNGESFKKEIMYSTGKNKRSERNRFKLKKYYYISIMNTSQLKLNYSIGNFSDIKSLDLVSTENLVLEDSLSISNPISEDPIDSKSDDFIPIENDTIIVTYDTTIINDTLIYTEVIDTTLYYNFLCKTDSCAAENALLEGVGRVLTWGINAESDLELRYFTVADFFNQDTQFDWTIEKVKLNPDAEKFITYPKTIATSADGSIFIGEGNTQSIIEIKKDQTAEIVVSDIVLDKDLLRPSGLVIGSNKEIYFYHNNNSLQFNGKCTRCK